eukprot:4999468-Pyramimonas_sp.AAC.1
MGNNATVVGIYPHFLRLSGPLWEHNSTIHILSKCYTASRVGGRLSPTAIHGLRGATPPPNRNLDSTPRMLLQESTQLERSPYHRMAAKTTPGIDTKIRALSSRAIGSRSGYMLSSLA